MSGDRGTTGSNSYYNDRNGDTPVIRPTTRAEATNASRTFSFDDYTFSAFNEVAVIRPIRDIVRRAVGAGMRGIMST